MKPASTDIRGQLAAIRDTIVGCERCPRLRTYCQQIARDKRRAYRDDSYWGRPVPGFGDPLARLLLVGLAPAAHGANRTGRVFTGDGTGGSGDFLMAALNRTGFASIPTSSRIDDGLALYDAYIVMAVRCAPPENAPEPEEITRCLDHLDAEVAELPRAQVVVALGKIAFDVWLRLLKRRGATIGSPRPQFGHGVLARVDAPDGVPAIVLGCYHPSRQNTNTGKLTPEMMESVFRKAKELLK
ncbi:MAG TPA: uracil-DNA glycosylase [Vicinamibacterales bacterium]|jgi:uracil-DNA glycosylase|nr:uracil-DNA glycosylase [Vicinamibacterales bacterium]